MLAAAVPFLFLHATYQPGLSVDVGSSSVDATLADLAIACVVAAAVARGRREGWEPLRRARWLLVLSAAFVVVRRGLSGDPVAPRRGVRPRAACDQRGEVRVVRRAAARGDPRRALDARGRPAPPGARCLERRGDRLGTAAVPRPRLGVRGEAAGPARALVRRDPRLRRALGCGARRGRRGRRAGRRTSRRATLVRGRTRHGCARGRALRRDDRRDRRLARVRGRAARRSGRAGAARRAAPSRSPSSCSSCPRARR